ncbi:S-type Pyocin [Pseudomonas indica]|uniref:S-type Pyocin n=2 Tax=Pseudomonas indica TaxID=137658 RepID=A0A1G9FKP4_9PSED|nr:S-type Pyocin [Pseudomonas indica]
MASDQGPGPMPSVCQPALKNTPPKSWRTPKEPAPPQPQLGGWEFDKQPPRELIRPAPPPQPPDEPQPPMAKTFVKCCTIPEGLMDHPPVGDGWVRTSALRDYGNFALLGSRERNADGSIPLKKIGGSALPLTGTLAIGATTIGETAGGIATGVTTGVTVGFLLGLVSFLWPTQTGDSAMYTEDELRERTTARTRARIHVEEQPDGTLKGYAWYTAPDKRALRWETVPVIPFQPQGDAFVADFGNGANLTWTPAVDTSQTLGIPALEASPEMPAVWVYPPTETVDRILVNPVYPPDFKDAILIFPADSGVPPLYVVMNVRLDPGVVTGRGEVVTGIWLEQASRELGAPIPAQIADKLRGKAFSSFDAFRKAFWTEVGNDAELSSQFGRLNQANMKNGFAPFPIPAEQVGGRKVFELHHVEPIAQGGAVYDMDNLRIITPKRHIELHSNSGEE